MKLLLGHRCLKIKEWVTKKTCLWSCMNLNLKFSRCDVRWEGSFLIRSWLVSTFFFRTELCFTVTVCPTADTVAASAARASRCFVRSKHRDRWFVTSRCLASPPPQCLAFFVPCLSYELASKHSFVVGVWYTLRAWIYDLFWPFGRDGEYVSQWL